MKILKYLFFLLLIVIIGGAIYFSTQDGSFDVAESKIIDAPPSVVYDQVKDYKTWQEWGPWMAIDPNIKINYSEKTEGEGASYSWISDDINVGEGSMETTKVIPNKEIAQKITFSTPIGDSTSDVYWKFEETETMGQTKVTWGMKGEQTLIEKVFMAFQEDDMETGISEMYKTGLNSLETKVKEELAKYTVNVDGVTLYPGGFYMYNTTAAKMSDIGTKMAPMMGQVAGFMEQGNIQSSGMPFTIYNNVDQTTGNVIFSTAIPVRERVITPEGSDVLCGYMEPVRTVKTTLKGDYTNLDKAYAAGAAYMAENQLPAHPSAKMFEVYVTDPGNVSNPADWVTEVYMPVAPEMNAPN